jgi:hypothetical protein
MKRIFLIFLTIVCLFFSDFAVAQSDFVETSESRDVSSQKTDKTNQSETVDKTFPENWQELLPKEVGRVERGLISLYKIGHDWKQENQNLIEQADKAKEIKNPLSSLYLMTYTEANPISGLDGLGEWQTTPFGRMRLISCETGLKKNKPMYVGVQMEIHEHLALTKPKITLRTPVKQSVISYPIAYPLPEGWTRTQFYFNTILFPIFFEPIKYDETLPVQVQVEWTAINPFDNVKISDTSLLNLTLKPNAIGETGLCGYMMAQLNMAPAPARDNVQAQARVNQQGDIQLFFELKHKTKMISVQIDDEWTFEVVDKKVNGDMAVFVIKPSQPIVDGSILPVKLITSFGVFDVPTTLRSGEFKKEIEPFRWWSLFKGGILLFFGTPLFAYFLLNMKRTAKQLEKSTTEVLVVLFCTGFAWALSWQADLIPAVSLVQLNPWFCLVIIGCLVYWIINPRLSLGISLLMVILLPKPYLNDAIGFAEQYNFAPLGMGLVWTAMVMWPFTWIKRYPKAFFELHKLMQQEMKAILWFARLPAIFLLIWVIVGGLVNIKINQGIENYTAEQVKQAVLDGKIAVVSVENPVCFSCAFNKIVAFNSGKAGFLRRQGNLVVFKLPADSSEAKYLMQQFGQLSAPMIVMYGPQNPMGIVAPDYLRTPNISKYLNLVR